MRNARTRLSCEPLGDRIVPALTSFTYDLGDGAQTGYVDYNDATVDPVADDQSVPLTFLAVVADGQTVTTGDLDPGATVHLISGQVAGVAFQSSALGVQYTSIGATPAASQITAIQSVDQTLGTPPKLDITKLLAEYNLALDTLEANAKIINDLVKDIQTINANLAQLYGDLDNAATDAEKAAIKAKIDGLEAARAGKQGELIDGISVFNEDGQRAQDMYLLLQASGQANDPIPLPPPPQITIPSGVLPPPPNYVPGYYA